jgi:hypothetical protein
VHHRHERGARIDHGLVDACAAVDVHGDAAYLPAVPFKPVAGTCGGGVLDHAGDDAASRACLGDATDREVVGLRAARGEEHLVGLASNEPCDLLPRVLHGLSRPQPQRVPARRVAEVLAQVGQHGVDDLGEDRRGRVVIEIDQRLFCVLRHDVHPCIQGFAR